MNEGTNAVETKNRVMWSPMAAVLLVMAYLWALCITEWRFRSYDAQLSAPDIYMQAFFAGFSITRYPMGWLSAAPGWGIVVIVGRHS